MTFCDVRLHVQSSRYVASFPLQYTVIQEQIKYIKAKRQGQKNMHMISGCAMMQFIQDHRNHSRPVETTAFQIWPFFYVADIAPADMCCYCNY